jgi:hypothetical protein
MLTDSRSGLVVTVQASRSDGMAERVVVASMMADVARPGNRINVGVDKAR